MDSLRPVVVVNWIQINFHIDIVKGITGYGFAFICGRDGVRICSETTRRTDDVSGYSVSYSTFCLGNTCLASG
ncbi:unknown [Vaccinia virus WR]|uniref:Uncharacterized protein VACWR003 n=1 Tax=Vaccinia virus (strain Western Reserve) TaxID=10254 RepID=VA003_VACCW|nr:hypothetical protein VACWR003 [Vaccinia virus]YP_233098.1 hypothetical protein VACWR216 [Vaccinia virus]Q805P9.1 RecName: Full=Uncharacterized protein VACWR003 [Vaccinia virus WR]AAO89282.1 unknown [Vaccinia virus WR]AAO89495.1 unknown [Vaccinia virus WR]